MTDKNVKRLIESIDTIDIGKIAIEPTVDTDTGVKSLGYKDPDGNARRVLTADKLAVLALKTELGNAKYIQSAFISEDLPAEDDPKTWYMKLIHYWNNILWSEDFEQSPWTKIGCTINALVGIESPLDGVDWQAIVADNGTQDSYIRQSVQVDYNTGSYRFYIKKGDLEFAYFKYYPPGNPTVYFYLNLNTGVVTSETNVDNISVTDMGNGYCVQLDCSVWDVAGFMYTYACDSASATTGTGDGSTDSIYVQGVQLRKGTIADNFPYLKTTTVPVSAPAFIFEENTTPNKLVNADTKAIETPAKDTLYIAPEPYQTQGCDDTVYAQLISGTGYTATATEIIHGGGSVGKVIAIEGGCFDFSNSEWLANGYYVSSSYYVSSKIVTTTLNIERGASMDDTIDDTHMWFYFTLA